MRNFCRDLPIDCDDDDDDDSDEYDGHEGQWWNCRGTRTSDCTHPIAFLLAYTQWKLSYLKVYTVLYSYMKNKSNINDGNDVIKQPNNMKIVKKLDEITFERNII